MRPFLWIIFLSVCFVSTRKTNDRISINSDGQLVMTFETHHLSTFFSNKIFGNIELILLETKDDCLIGREPIGLYLDNHHFFIKDNQQKIIFRFDRAGKFINSIGRRGMGPEEYSAIYDLYIDTLSKAVEILAPKGQILRYGYDGNFISKQSYDESLLSFIKARDNYWFYTHQMTGNERLMKVSEDGTVIVKYLPSKTDWMPIAINNYMDQCGYWITFKDMFSSTVYRITDDGPVETTVIDFGKHTIQEHFYQMDLSEALNELGKKGCAGILKYFENDQFIYLFFFIVRQADLPNDHYHWLVNKKTGNSVLHKLSSENSTEEDDIHKGAKALTADNQLVFMMNKPMLNDPFFSNAKNIKDSLSEESNPVIALLRINNF